MFYFVAGRSEGLHVYEEVNGEEALDGQYNDEEEVDQTTNSRIK